MAANTGAAWWPAARPSRWRGRKRATPRKRCAKCWETGERRRRSSRPIIEGSEPRQVPGSTAPCSLLLLRRRGRRRPHADDLEHAVAGFRLRAVPVNLARMIHHVGSGGSGIGVVGIPLRTRADPPRPGNDIDVPLFAVIMRTARVAGMPPDQLDVQPRFARIALNIGGVRVLGFPPYSRRSEQT